MHSPHFFILMEFLVSLFWLSISWYFDFNFYTYFKNKIKILQCISTDFDLKRHIAMAINVYGLLFIWNYLFSSGKKCLCYFKSLKFTNHNMITK